MSVDCGVERRVKEKSRKVIRSEAREQRKLRATGAYSSAVE